MYDPFFLIIIINKINNSPIFLQRSGEWSELPFMFFLCNVIKIEGIKTEVGDFFCALYSLNISLTKKKKKKTLNSLQKEERFHNFLIFP